jgi:hypothetical protein
VAAIDKGTSEVSTRSILKKGNQDSSMEAAKRKEKKKEKLIENKH